MSPNNEPRASILTGDALALAGDGKVVGNDNVMAFDGGELAAVDLGSVLVHIAGVVDDIDVGGTEDVDTAAAVVKAEVVLNKCPAPVGFDGAVAVFTMWFEGIFS